MGSFRRPQYELELSDVIDLVLEINAGADCGFASFAATVEFMPEIVWAKLEALAEGARRASARLWQ